MIGNRSPRGNRERRRDSRKNHGHEVKATKGGVPLAAVAAVLSHQSIRTTSMHYDGTEIPSMVALPFEPHYPDDPITIRISKGHTDKIALVV